MDMIRIGQFLQGLRKASGRTQEQLAEQLGVARRTVSRWETGANMPDLDILLTLSDLYSVDLRELLSGERKDSNMNEELRETVKQVAAYSSEEKQRSTKVMRVYFILGILALTVNAVLTVAELPDTWWTGFLKGGTIGFSLVTMGFGLLYTTGRLEKLHALKMRLMSRGKQEG